LDTPANVSTQYFEDGNVSFKATAAVTGKRFLKPSADQSGGPGLSTDIENLLKMATCGAGQKSSGVSKYDVASGSEGGVHGQPGMIVPVTAGGAITVGQEVMSDATGKAVPWTSAASEANRALGLAMSGAANGADAMIKLY
jgi:hypothetical protein